MNQPDMTSKKSLLAAILLGVVGLSMPNISPIFLGATADHLGFSYEQIGLLGGVEILGISLAAVSAVFWVQKVAWRTAAVLGLLVCVAGNLLSGFVDSFTELLVLRALIGLLGEGVVFSIGVRALGESRDPDRAYALMVTGQVAWMMTGMLALPYAAELWGVAGIALPVALAIILVIPTTLFLPAGSRDGAGFDESPTVRRAPVLWLVLAQFTWYAGAFSIFAFVERIGNESGFAATDIGVVLAIGMGMSLLGSLLAALQGDRFGRLLPFILTMLIQCGFALLLIDVESIRYYAMAWIMINTVWNYGLPYIYSAVNAADDSGRYVVMVPAAQGFGGAVGTIIAGFVVAGFGLNGVVYLLICANLLAALSFAKGIFSAREVSIHPERVQ